MDPEKQTSNSFSKDTAWLYSAAWSEGGIVPESDISSTKFYCVEVLPTNFQDEKDNRNKS